MTIYHKSARYYDAIYLQQKDYHREAEILKQIIIQQHPCPANRLLDIACGTGLHLQWLQDDFQVEGMDINPDMLEIARERLPGLHFHQADMTNFDLASRYDIILCLFSSIGYVKTLEKLRAALGCMFDHLYPGGLLLVEPWFTPQAWQPNTVHAVFVDKPDLKIARINTSLQEGNLAVMDMHHLVGTPEETFHFVERHELGLFEIDEMISAFKANGFTVSYDQYSFSKRGLYLASKPVERNQDGTFFRS